MPGLSFYPVILRAKARGIHNFSPKKQKNHQNPSKFQFVNKNLLLKIKIRFCSFVRNLEFLKLPFLLKFR
ncbi:hypothetical protein FSU_2792 [Fibrobacter succinogenes subsp. succinogenes S85]|uniref:Uncharacterized protein n=1 Tax=Fibrobacter succinogenes (strain ATCC 19169 / S85) TaxID=59374 RepID=D9S6S2_FIBSS|nr:hypothetical protein FSU_2792 [Fibrobacter succinogenes subsp. succinogenes S85]